MFGQRDDDVRVADVDPEAGPWHAETAGTHEDLVGLDPPRAQIDLEPEVAAGDRLDAGPRADQERSVVE